MGIKQLFSLLEKKAPNSFRTVSLEVFSSKLIACDASKILYQFVIATTSANGEFGVQTLTDADGIPTGHLTGFIFRSLLMIEAGVKPVWVFDGIPPDMKRNELKRRKRIKLEAKEKEAEARETGTAEEELKYHVRSTQITPKMVEDSKKVLTLMGFPVVTAPGEAEAQCVQLLKEGRVSAVASDDMDCLTFGAEVLLRNIKTKKDPITEITLSDALREMGLNQAEFIDLCILCGCDYCETIGNMGPVGAFKAIEEHRSVEGVLAAVTAEEAERKERGQTAKYVMPLPQNFDFEAVRSLFLQPEVTKGLPSFEFGRPDEKALTEFLIGEKSFADQRVDGILARLRKAFAAKPQTTLESFLGKPVKIAAGSKHKAKPSERATPTAKRIKTASPGP